MKKMSSPYIHSMCVILILICQPGFSQNEVTEGSGVRTTPVSYHLSFDDDKFFKEDIIEQSGKKSLEERKIDFPEAKFGKGIRMREIPQTPDANNMTGIDLDLVTAVIFNTHPGNQMGFNQPFIWGCGRLNGRLGGVAFWARGELPFAGPLFEQTSIGFGRKERDLLGVLVDENNKLSAYVRDARYVSHGINSDANWNPSQWNHVVFNWDWANGLQLWINGEMIASSWGEDAWFETSLPGLFHLPAAGLIFDELYLFDRPITRSEILALIRSNSPPKNESPGYSRQGPETRKIRELSGTAFNAQLPAVNPGEFIVFTEVWPEMVSDEFVPGWHVVDGRNEIAWPHPYSMFTIIPGDADFHPEKVDIQTKHSSQVNYVVMNGNLTNVTFEAATPRDTGLQRLFSVPAGNQFYFAASIKQQEGASFRVPFTEKYGTPKGFSGDINVPLSGEKRIQNLGLYHTQVHPGPDDIKAMRRLVFNASTQELDPRTTFALHAVTSRDERTFTLASVKETPQVSTQINVGAFARLNILSDAYVDAQGINSITLSIPVKTENANEAILIRVRDPGVPSRLWNQFIVGLSGYDSEFKTLQLKLDFQDLVLTDGDRLWVDIGAAGKTEILIGDPEMPAVMFVKESDVYTCVDNYAAKEIVSAQAQYGKMYEFMPWQFTRRTVSLSNPYCYGGPFDMILPALAIKRVKPDHFIANYLIRMSGPDFKDGKPRDPERMPLITLPNPNGVPEWALYMRDFNAKRHKIANWWAERQNADGQLGGGWNDDVLFLSSHQPDLPLDGNENARYLIDATHKGLEKTRYFKDGYCNIFPMDRMHIGDFISERYNSVVNNLGQAYAFERELESAWRLEDKSKTPINYFADGFKSSFNVFNWYWGNDVPQGAYVSKGLEELAEEFRRYTSVLDDYSFYRFTESNVHRDDYSPYGANNMYTYMLGGKRGTRLDAHLKLAVIWPAGGGPDLARVVLYADDDSLRVAAFSFRKEMTELVMQPCRIKDGRYRINILEDPLGNGEAGKVIWETEKDLTRFDRVKLPIPSHIPVAITLKKIISKQRPTALADLAIDIWDAEFENNSIHCVIHNLGNAPAKAIAVRLLDGDKVLDEYTIDGIAGPVDFVAKRENVVFTNVSYSGNLFISIDPENKISEILEDNNRVPVSKKGVFQKGLAPRK
ncbi:MAG: hypothetical protein HKN76_01915 [Saprospiraceae bacterium]|nr:hypothetical protein [Saprospiraceae bacterium]